MCKLCVFAGTTEGRELVEFLAGQNAQVYACVATEYGQTLLPPFPNVTVSAARLTQPEMESLFQKEQFQLVIDATHPYAAAVTENIVAACAATGTEYHRLLRADVASAGEAVYVEHIPQALEYLASTTGNILLTTGSKELKQFAPLPEFSQRVYARVLPMEQSLQLCREAGLQPSHILAMQGPFSTEMNVAMLKTVGASILVTKSSGVAGGFPEKLEAARALGLTAVIIGRPPQQAGMDLNETVGMLCRKFGFVPKPRVDIVGIGPGSRSLQTPQVQQILQEAQCLIGAKRMLEAVQHPGALCCPAIAPAAIRECMEQHPELSRFAVVMSGDVGFFSGTKKLLEELDGWNVAVHPGISSLVYLCAKFGKSYEDVEMVTLHGRQNPILLPLSRGKRVFALVGGDNGMGKLLHHLQENGLGSTMVYAGENLSYPQERLYQGTAESLRDTVFDPLCVALLEPTQGFCYTPGLPDEAFRRTESVPMTKSEIRAVCLSKLALPEGAVVWDVGAGTGSVTVEMALSAPKGQVYAIEQKPAAVETLRGNVALFHADNVTVVPGTAPEACAELPAPTHAFLGGTSGNLQEIVDVILTKNPAARIVATAVTMESIAALTACAARFRRAEIVTLSVARARPVGHYHLLTAQNPVYVFTMDGGVTE